MMVLAGKLLLIWVVVSFLRFAIEGATSRDYLKAGYSVLDYMSVLILVWLTLGVWS